MRCTCTAGRASKDGPHGLSPFEARKGALLSVTDYHRARSSRRAALCKARADVDEGFRVDLAFFDGVQHRQRQFSAFFPAAWGLRGRRACGPAGLDDTLIGVAIIRRVVLAAIQHPDQRQRALTTRACAASPVRLRSRGRKGGAYENGGHEGRHFRK